MLAPRFLLNTPTFVGVLTFIASGCKNVPTNGALGDLDRGVDQTTERALPPPEGAAPMPSALLYVPAATASSNVDTGNAGARRTGASADASAAPSDSAAESEGVVPNEDAGAPDPMRLDITVAELDGPSCSIWVDGDLGLQEKDLAVYHLTPDGKNPRSLVASNPKACMPTAVETHTRDAELDSGRGADAGALPAGEVDRIGLSGSLEDAGVSAAESGWFLTARDEGMFLEFCPDGCAQLKDMGGRLLIDVRWGVRFYAR